MCTGLQHPPYTVGLILMQSKRNPSAQLVFHITQLLHYRVMCSVTTVNVRRGCTKLDSKYIGLFANYLDNTLIELCALGFTGLPI